MSFFFAAKSKTTTETMPVLLAENWKETKLIEVVDSRLVDATPEKLMAPPDVLETFLLVLFVRITSSISWRKPFNWMKLPKPSLRLWTTPIFL